MLISELVPPSSLGTSSLPFENVFYIDHFNSQVISYFISIAMTISKILYLEVIHAKSVQVAMERM